MRSSSCKAGMFLGSETHNSGSPSSCDHLAEGAFGGLERWALTYDI